MIHILGKKQKSKKSPVSSLPQPCSRSLSLSFPGLHSSCYHCGLYSAPWVMARRWRVRPQQFFSVSLFFSLFSSTASSFSLVSFAPARAFHSPLRRATAPAWAHQSARVPLLWSTSFCSGCGCSAFLLFVPVSLFQALWFHRGAPGWQMGVKLHKVQVPKSAHPGVDWPQTSRLHRVLLSVVCFIGFLWSSKPSKLLLHTFICTIWWCIGEDQGILKFFLIFIESKVKNSCGTLLLQQHNLPVNLIIRLYSDSIWCELPKAWKQLWRHSRVLPENSNGNIQVLNCFIWQ